MVALANIYTWLDDRFSKFRSWAGLPQVTPVAMSWYVSRRVNMKSLAASQIPTESRCVNRKAA